MSISLRRLQAFALVADQGSVIKAAKILGLSPSAITKSIRELEAELDNISLLKRSADGMILTGYGEALYAHAKLALREISRGIAAIDTLRGGKPKVITIGVLPDSDVIVPKSVSEFLARRSDINVAIRGGTLQDHVNSVLEGEMDLFSGAEIVPNATSGIETQVICRDELSIIVRPGHPLTKRSRIRIDELTEARWVLPSAQSPIWVLLKNYLSSADLPHPQTWVEVHHFSTLRTLLRESDMISVAPFMRVKDEVDAGLLQCLRIDMQAIPLSISVAHLPRKFLNEHVRALLSTILKVGKSWTENDKALPKDPAERPKSKSKGS